MKNPFRRKPPVAPDEPVRTRTRAHDHFAEKVTARCPICLKRKRWKDFWIWVDLAGDDVVHHLQTHGLQVNLPPNQRWNKDGDEVQEGTTWVAGSLADMRTHKQRVDKGWVLLDPSVGDTREMVNEGWRLQVLTPDNMVRVCPHEVSLRGRPRDAVDEHLPPQEAFRHGDVVRPEWLEVPAALIGEDKKAQATEALDVQSKLFPGYRVDAKSKLHHVPPAYGNGGEIYLIPVLGDSQAGKSSWILQLNLELGPGFPINCGDGVRVRFSQPMMPASLLKLAEGLRDEKARQDFFDNYWGTDGKHGAHLLLEVGVWRGEERKPFRRFRILLADFAGEALRNGQYPWGEAVVGKSMEYASGAVFLRTAADLIYEVKEAADKVGRPKILLGAIDHLGDRTIPAAYVVSQADRVRVNGTAQPLVRGVARALGGDPEGRPQPQAEARPVSDDLFDQLTDGPQDRPREPGVDGPEKMTAAAKATRAIELAAASPNRIKTDEHFASVQQRRASHHFNPLFGAFNTESPTAKIEEVIQATTEALGGLVLASLDDGDLTLMLESPSFDPISVHALSAKQTSGLYEPLVALLHHMKLLT